MEAFENTGQNPDGTVKYTYNDATYPIVKDIVAEARLKKYVANLDTMRQLIYTFGYGPMGHEQFDN
jgi:hypothetical protein